MTVLAQRGMKHITIDFQAAFILYFTTCVTEFKPRRFNRIS